MDLVEAQKFKEGEQIARRCVKVVIRRLLGEQIADVAVLGSGKKEDAMWHVPHHPPSLVVFERS